MPFHCQALYSAILHSHTVEHRIRHNVYRTDDSCNNEKNLNCFHFILPQEQGLLKSLLIAKPQHTLELTFFAPHSLSTIQTTV